MIVTFYSYKGGVGRSMAMANVADLLARAGRKVLMVDFDLEAPGLEQYFQFNHAAARRSLGLLDLLLAYKRAMSAPAGSEDDEFRQIDKHIVPVYATLPGGGCLHLLPAGQRDGREQLERYAASLRTFDWQDFYFNWEGELFFEWLRNELVPGRYDLVLVDSRTGVTEMGGICTYQLADAIVMLCAANHQNRQGTKSVALDFESGPVQTARPHRSLQILVVPARVEQRSKDLYEEFIATFQDEFARYLPDRLREKGLGFRELTIPYEPIYAFEERVLSDPNQGPARREIATAFKRLAEAVVVLTGGDRKTTAAAAGAPGDPPLAEAGASQFDPAKRFAGYDVFLSYDAADKSAAVHLLEHLTAGGLQVFLDARSLTAGEDWRARIEQTLFHSKLCMLAFGSADAPAGHRDMLAAIRTVCGVRNLPVVPVLFPGADPERVTTELGADLASRKFLDLRDGLDGSGARAEIERTVASLHPQVTPVSTATAEYTAPYLGLSTFKERDAGLFFGRERAREEVATLVERLPFVLVTGPSGCGKTSFVTAGVMSELRRRATDSGTGWLIARCTASRGIEGLAEARATLTAPGGTEKRQRLLFVDDAEELAFGVFAEDKRAFAQRLAGLCGGAEGIRVIASVREDCIPALAARAPDLPLSGEHVYPLPPLTTAEIRRLTEGPAEKVGLAFEPGLIDCLMTDWGGDQRFLPFLQLVLRSLWERRREGFLTNDAYQAIPDPVEAIAEAAYKQLPADHQAAAARVLPRLIRLCGDLELTRSCAREDLRLPGIDASVLDATLEALIQARVLCAFAVNRQPRIAPAFASPQWARAEQWLEQDREFLEWLERFDQYRRDWIANDRDEGALLAGALLREARRWLEKRRSDLNSDETAYIDASSTVARRRVRRQRIAAGVAGLAAVAVLVGLKWESAQHAMEARQEQRLDALVLGADGALNSGDIEAALASYREVLSIEPNHPIARVRRGALLDGQGKPEEAIRDFSVVIENTADGDDVTWKGNAYNGRAVAKLHAGRPQEALQDIEEALKLSPNDPVSLYNRAVVHEALGKPDLAINDYGEVLARIQPQQTDGRATAEYATTLFNRGLLYQKLGKTNLATADFKSILAVDVDAKTKQAAAARLESLGTTSASPQERTYRVELYYADANDEKPFNAVTAALADNRFEVQRVDKVSDQPSSPVVRFFFKEDAGAAANVRQIAESALASQGYNVRLQAVFVPLKNVENRRGEIHLRVPSLKLRALPSDLYRQAPLKKGLVR